MRRLVLISLIAILALLPASLALGQSYNYSIPIYVEWFNIHYPTAAGAHTAWTGTFADVDDNWRNYNDADYITSSTNNTKISFAFANWVGDVSVDQVNVVVRGRKIFAADDIELFYREDAIDYSQGSLSPSGSFSNLGKTFTENPATGGSWNTTSINGMEWGVEIVGTTGAVYVSQMYVKVIPSQIEGVTSFTELPIVATLDVQGLIDDGFVSPNITDTNLNNASAFSPTDTTIPFTISSMSAYETVVSNFRLGYSPNVTDFDLSVGYSGNVTFSDNANLELSDNFTIIHSGYIDTSTGGSNRYLLHKNDAIDIWVSAPNTISVSTGTSPASETLRPNAAGDECNIGNENGAGCPDHYQNVDEVVADDTTTTVKDNQTTYRRDLYNTTNSTGSGTITQIEVFGRFRHKTNTPTQEHIRINIKTGGSVFEQAYQLAAAETWTNKSNVWTTNPDTSAAWTWSEIDDLQIGPSVRRGAPASGANNSECTQIYVVVSYTSGSSLATIDSISSGVHTVTVTGNVTDLAIDVDGVSSVNTTVPLVSNNAADWYIMENNAIRYMDYMTLSTNGTQQLWYQPDTLIDGVNLVDRSSNSLNGTIAWGANPAGITVWVGPLIASDVYAVSAVVEDDVSTMYTPPIDAGSYPTGTGEGLPFFDIVNPAAVAMGMEASVMYHILFTAGAVGIGATIFIISGLAVVGVLATAVILGVGATQNIIPTWGIVVGFVMSLSILYLWRRF